MSFKFAETKMFSIIAIVLLVTAVALTIVVQKNTQHAFLKTQEENAQNLLNAVYLNVENEYQSILYHKEAILELRKKEVKDITALALLTVEEYYEKYKSGTLNKKSAQKQAIQTLRNLRYDNGVGYIWINNTDRDAPKLIMHPTMPELEGRIMLDPKYNCAMGINKNLFHAFIDICKDNNEGYVDYLWPKPTDDGLTEDQPKISYVMYFKSWDWIIGSGVYIDDIEKEGAKRLEAVKKEVETTFNKVKLARNGYMFILDGEQKAIIHPQFSGKDMSVFINPSTQNSISSEILAAAHTENKSIEYLWNKPPTDNKHFTYKKKTYVRYFKPLNWYIAASFYQEDINKPVTDLTQKLIILSSLLLVIFLFGTIFFTKIIRKQHTAEEEVHRIDQLLKDVLSAASEVAIIATNNDGIITLFNSGAENMLGYTSEEMEKTETPLILHKESEIIARSKELTQKYDRPITGYRVLVERTDITGYEKRNWTYIKKDGSEIQVSLVVTAIKDDYNKIKGYVAIALDITTQKRAEKELRESKKMDAIGQLAGGIAHDFNNMLAGILSAAEIVHLSIKEDQELSELTNLIVDSAKRSSELTDKLLAFSRKSRSIIEIIDINEAIQNAVTLLRSSINKKVNITTNLNAKNHNISGDLTQLQNVFINLGINASHAMPEGGELTIDSDIVSLDKDYCNSSIFNLTPGEHISIEIKDSGSGIPAEIIDRIFEPFFTTKKQGEGTGLGLAAVYGTIQQHNGAINVYSEQPKGTSFHLYLPLTNQEKSKKQTSAIPVAGTGMVLVVDDEYVVRTTTSAILKKLGYSVILADNGTKAIELFLEYHNSLDLVILDMLMPKMDGRECFHKLKDINPNVNIIICSGFSKDTDMQELKENGLSGFIHKPFSSSELSRVVAECIRS